MALRDGADPLDRIIFISAFRVLRTEAEERQGHGDECATPPMIHFNCPEKEGGREAGARVAGQTDLADRS
jgi:hypothetical protein